MKLSAKLASLRRGNGIKLTDDPVPPPKETRESDTEAWEYDGPDYREKEENLAIHKEKFLYNAF